MAKAKDRWERIVTKKLKCKEVVQLLRQQHRTVVRMVKQELAECEEMERKLFAIETERANWYGWNCRSAQCRQILDQLARRAR